MHLRNLNIKGFKSFAKKTVLEFEPGVTMVVGPNGSGKSNVVDAIQWVLGEQSPSQLRGQAMEDVIFCGTQTTKPSSLCEVSLILDNEDNSIPIDFAEVCITRRMLKTGESNYFINGTPCRLLDVFELLSDTGLGRNTHSIIAQGKIDEVIHCKPEERRHLIEEAAGVLKHKKRKERSLRKLNSVDDNLKRIKDILREVKKHTGPLKAHIEKAQKHKEIESRLMDLKTADAVKKLIRLKGRFEKTETSKKHLINRQSELASDLDVKKTELSKAEGNLELQQNKYAKQSEAYVKHLKLKSGFEKTAILLNQKKERLDSEIRGLEEKIKRSEQEKNSLEGKISHLQKEKSTIESDTGRTYKRLKNVQASATEIKLKWKEKYDSLNELNKNLQNAKNELYKLKENCVHLKTSLNTSKEKIHFLKKEQLKIQEEKEIHEKSLVETKARLKQEKSALGEIEAGLQENISTKANLEESILRKEKELKAAERAYFNSISKKEALEKAFGFLIKTDGSLSFADVKIDSGYEKAFEQAVSSYRNTTFSSNKKQMEEMAVQSSAWQAVVNLGFKVANNKDPRALINKLRAPSKIRKALAIILEDIYVANSIAETDEEKTWILTNGSVYRKGLLLALGNSNIADEHAKLNLAAGESLKEKERLEKEAGRLREKINNITGVIDDLDSSLHQASNELTSLLSKKDSLKEKIVSLESKKDEIDKSLGIEILSLANLKQQFTASDKLIKDNEDVVAGFEANAKPIDPNEELRRHESEKEVHEIKLTLASLNERQLFINQQSKEAGQALLKAGEALKGLEGEAGKARNEQAKLARLIKHFIVLKPLLADEELKTENFETEKELISSLKEDCIKITGAIEEITRETGKADVEITEIQTKVDVITEKITEELKVPLENALELAGLEFDRSEIQVLENELKNMGPVNFAAYDQFNELRDREEFLEKQVDDLYKSKDSLRRIIRAIDRKIVEEMASSFEAVKYHFEKMFTTLFPGGKANLYLTDENDILNTGVEIEVQPAGKKLSKLSLLSGGETALTALALLFAIYHAKPSPFYVLDEVEAALDDVNLQRFIRLIEDMKNQTQFIVITHQKRTMETADCLYGISMRADGITRVISQKMENNIEGQPKASRKQDKALLTG